MKWLYVLLVFLRKNLYFGPVTSNLRFFFFKCFKRLKKCKQKKSQIVFTHTHTHTHTHVNAFSSLIKLIYKGTRYEIRYVISQAYWWYMLSLCICWVKKVTVLFLKFFIIKRNWKKKFHQIDLRIVKLPNLTIKIAF